MVEFARVARACLLLYQESEAARSPQQLEAASERFGKTIGGTGLRVVVAVASMGLGRLLPGPPEGGLQLVQQTRRLSDAGGGSAAVVAQSVKAVAEARVVAAGVLVVDGMEAGTVLTAACGALNACAHAMASAGGTQLSTRYGPPHTRANPPHNEAIEEDLSTREAAGHTDLLKNKAQVNATKKRVFERTPAGEMRFRRPDASSVRPDGVRHNINYVSNAQDMQRELEAFKSLVKADSRAINELYLLDGTLVARHIPPGVWLSLARKVRRDVAHKLDVAQLRDELVDAFEWNEDDRARALMSQLAAQPGLAKVVLDEMLASEDASVRRAAVFGLGEMGDSASVKRLEQQMTTEEAREDHDGESVLEVITQMLGRIKDAGARTSLIRRLKRLASGKVPTSGASDLAYVLWRKRHPELIPLVRSALEQLPAEDSWALRALLLLLETSPVALTAWALDMSVALDLKANVLAILDEEVPAELLAVMPAFITLACHVGDSVGQQGAAAEYCDRLFITLLLHPNQVLPALPAGVLSELRALARKCVGARVPNCSTRAAHMLQQLGHPEDAALIEANRPDSPILAELFDDIAQALRKLPTD